MKRFAPVVFAVAIAAASSGPAIPATATSTMAVSAGVTANCELVATNDLDFGTITASDRP
jgi:spore coat protein U-like protein